ncbi:MAG: histidine ammonia-lyase [Hyphomicrobiales bacterium]|nr:histidine ammonia-lyase [Hyphomicrobiales bacterium]
MTRIGDGPVTLDAFAAALRPGGTVGIAPAVRARLAAARAVVDAAAAGDAPVYGLNTGLGANLGHRIAPADIAAFQHQLIAGRAVAVGEPLPEGTGRAVLLARLVSAAPGHSGMSLPLFDHLCAVFGAGLSPVVPRYGSIGAGDLTQNAVWAQALLGAGRMWRGGETGDARAALAGAGLAVPPLRPKDAMALVNHGGLSVALAAHALGRARRGLAMARDAALLSCAGYDANRDIFAAEVNALRPAPGQAETAAWFAARLAGGGGPPRRVQEALSFRVVAPVLGAAADALDRAVAVWRDEANGASDSPAVVGEEAMRSTPNFQAPALALALEGVALALAMAAAGAVQRMQRMMDPDLTGLPRYLSPRGGAAAGMVPLQKTVAALLADIRRHAQPVAFDPAPVSDGVEDMAPMTPAAALKLADMAAPFDLLCGAEVLVAAQAVDLRQGVPLAPAVADLHARLRAEVPMLDRDRPLGEDVGRAAEILGADRD